MPRLKVREMWQECFNRKRPLLLSDLKPNVHVMMRAHNLMCAQGKTEVANVTGFFSILAEWSQAELSAPANDNTNGATPDGEGVRNDR